MANPTRAKSGDGKKSQRREEANSTPALPQMTLPLAPSSAPQATPRKKGDKSLETWIWDAACSIRGAKDAAKYKDFILPLIFAKRLCDVFDDEINRIAREVGSRAKAFKLVEADWRQTRSSNQKPMVRFYLPMVPKNPDDPVWSVIRTLSDRIGEQLTNYLLDIADANPKLKGIINRVDFNATVHGQRELDDDRLSNLIEKISAKRLGLADVEPDIIGRSYEYLIRKFAEGKARVSSIRRPRLALLSPASWHLSPAWIFTILAAALPAC